MTTVRGPITGGDRGWPFGAAAFDLGRLGYTEEEYFLSGEAARFDFAPGTSRSFDGKWSITPTGETESYCVRMLVRRPNDARRFNGTVVLMWSNVSIGYEIFTGESRSLYDIGCAFVGVGPQRIGIHGYPEGENRGLRAWDPARYGELHVADDGLSFDIYNHAAQAVGPGRPSSVDPLGGLQVERVLGMGVSQSANRLATFHNAFQPLSGALDGLLLDVYFGNGAPLDPRGQPSLARPDQIAGRVTAMPPGTHLLRDDLGIPIFVMNSETEASSHYPVRQPESDTYRFWEIAGIAHGSDRISDDIPSTWQRDLGFRGHPLAPEGPNNPLTLDGVRAAVIVHVHEWMAEGKLPPSMPRIEFEGDPPRVARDRNGIAKGGIRLPDVEVPRACYSGLAADGSLALFGSTTPFADEQLRSLYRDEDGYRERHEGARRAAVAAGALLT